MALQLTIESLRARGEITAAEHDRLMQLLEVKPPARSAPKLLSPLRAFLLGAVFGVGLAYLAWGLFR